MGGTNGRVGMVLTLALAMLLGAARADAATRVAIRGPLGAPPAVTYDDVTLDWTLEGDDWLRFCRHADGSVGTCNDFERDMRQLYLSFYALPEALALAADIPGCEGAVRKGIDDFGVIEKLAANYRYRANKSAGWSTHLTGEDYRRTSPHALEALRACLIDAADAVVRSATAGMKTLFRLDDAGAPLQLHMPAHAEFDPGVVDLGIIGPVTKLPVLTARQSALLDLLVEAHHRGVGAQEALAAFVASATTLVQQRAFMLPPFRGDNGGWRAADDVLWDALEHEAFMAWARSVRARDNLNTQRAMIDHAQTHLCENMGPGTGLEVFLSINGTSRWKYETCEAVLVRVRASILPTATPRRTPAPGQTPQPTSVPPVGAITTWRFYAELASGAAVNVPLRSGDAPLLVAIPAAELAAFPVGQRKPVTPTAAPIFEAAVRTYLATHPQDYPSGAAVSAIRTAQRVAP